MTGSATYGWVVILVALLTVSVIAFHLKWMWMRYLTLLISLIYFGFYNTTALAGPGWLEDIILKIHEFTKYLPFYLIVIAILLFTLVFGQFFCGWVCPMGAIQEFLHDFHRRQVRIPEKLDAILGVTKYIFAAYLLLNAVIKHTKLHYLNPFFVAFNLEGPKLLVLMAFLVFAASIFVYRPWCRWFCPFSAIFNLLSKISFFQLKTNERCTNCILGERVCRIGAIKIETQNGARSTKVINSKCIRCGDCVASCPRKGIGIEFVLNLSRESGENPDQI